MYEKKIKREIKLELILTYSDMDGNIVSFANYVNTVDNGSHVDGIKEAISRYLSKAASDAITQREKSSITEIRWSDVIDGLILAINLSTDHSIGFASQSKSKIDSKDIFDICKSLTGEMIQEFFEANEGILQEYIKRIKINARTRLAQTTVRNRLIKPMSRYEESSIEHFKRCNNDKKDGYRELFIIEGDSAMSAAAIVRDPYSQAIFAMKGIPANALKRNEKTLLENERFASLLKVLQCGIGSTFNLANLRYDKIIILADADNDGYYIRSLFAAFFMEYLPEIVKAGKLFSAAPPLYRIQLKGKAKNKDDDLITDKRQYIKTFINEASNNFTISIHKQYLTREALIEFLYDAKNYLSDLIETAKMYRCNRFLLEMLWYMYSKNVNITPSSFNDIKVMKVIQDKFPYMHYEDSTHSLYGVIDGKYQSINISSQIFDKGSNSCIPVMQKYKTMFVDADQINTTIKLSIGEFLDCIEPYKPKIISRFKGLGEFEDPEDLKYTVLDPNTRTLTKLMIDDFDNDIKLLHVVHGHTQKEAADRKSMMKEFAVEADMIDN
jgi:DNA gyrase/topoisomerase IV subunit B